MAAATASTVTVLCASGRPGLAQVRRLVADGHRVRAVTRQTTLHETLRDVDVVAADLNDPGSLVAACRGADVVFYTAPAFAERSRRVEHITNVGRAVVDAGVGRLVYNTTSWFPDRPIGVPSMDQGYEMSQAVKSTGAPITIIRPSLFMDNLLTKWVKPYLLEHGEFSYPHAETLDVSWICLDDVAAWMIETMSRNDCEGVTLDVGGPETLRPTDVAELLSERLGRPIVYRRITPREFGERMYELFRDVSGLDRETYVSNLEKHYLFKNEANPFLVPMDDMTARFDVRPTPMREWLAAQDWTTSDEAIGSVSG
ncbi:SDR family oxidoreductase [Desertimonas flava]|jgi:uncharacterized protein YbjT (DUF2867 family)|uniref:SDR family oxidoreductase n=1 Tax=Desertimonas flava TaxID=2064846 RepID=UPI000E352BA3|nr:NmrA family NAD(P)-binding protein [Desertimonas flava]